jgi:hypothetical protein
MGVCNAVAARATPFVQNFHARKRTKKISSTHADSETRCSVREMDNAELI